VRCPQLAVWRVLLVCAALAAGSCGRGGGGGCGPSTFGIMQQTWCQHVFACRAAGGTDALGDIGASEAACTAKTDLVFTTELYSRLGGQSAAMSLIGQYDARFRDCTAYIAQTTCGTVTSLDLLFGAGGYCDPAVLNGSAPALSPLHVCMNAPRGRGYGEASRSSRPFAPAGC